jgi:hypothetical protein
VTSGSGFAQLRRAQALAASSPVDVEISRELLHAKISGQAALLADLPGGDQA